MHRYSIKYTTIVMCMCVCTLGVMVLTRKLSPTFDSQVVQIETERESFACSVGLY
jgi:hypothetical protein